MSNTNASETPNNIQSFKILTTIDSIIRDSVKDPNMCRLPLEHFVSELVMELDACLMKKYAMRCIQKAPSLFSVYNIGNSINDVDYVSGPIITAAIRELVRHGKTVKFTLWEDHDIISEEVISYDREFHPSVISMARRMQNKLDARSSKYKNNMVLDTWKKLNKVALMKHFDEEVMEFKSELYKFLNEDHAGPTPEERERMESELADVANIGFMLVERILCGSTADTEVLQDDEDATEIHICEKCHKPVQEYLMVGDLCYTCKKLEN